MALKWLVSVEAHDAGSCGCALRTGGKRVQQSSGIVPFMINGDFTQSLQSCVPSVMSSCSDAELWKTFDGAKYNNSTLSGCLWGEMENVSDNLNKTTQSIQHCASVSV